jgi:hypothetical protein
MSKQPWDRFKSQPEINHPQLGETNPPQQMDAGGEGLLYDKFITSILVWTNHV